jgi:4-amino-4-deoxy-L-arabinose transferase-like glycosyltransferase
VQGKRTRFKAAFRAPALEAREGSTLDDRSNPDNSDGVTTSPSRPSHRRKRRISAVQWLTFGLPALLSLSIGFWQLATPGAIAGLTAYDDGVYFGAALQWVNGLWPYRDFVFLHPPGIILLMSPIALLGKLFGTQNGLAVARVCTELVATLNVVLVTALVRRHGRVAAVLAGTLTALFPLAVANSSTLTLEPYLVFFVVAALVALVRAISNVNPNRWLYASGVLFGVAGLVKIWAIFPFVVASICVAVWFTRKSWRFFLGAVLAFGIPALPFIALSPGNFFHDVIADQVIRQASIYQQVSVSGRFFDILGFPGLPGSWLTPSIAVVAILVGVVGVAFAFWVDNRSPQRSDVLLFGVTLSTVVCLMVASEFQLYYSYFSAPFLAIVFALVIHKICRGVRTRWSDLHGLRYLDSGSFRVALAVLVVGATFAMAAHDFSYQRQFIEYNLRGNSGTVAEPGAVVSVAIPKGACAISDSPAVLILGNRYLSTTPDCPAIVDPYGMFLALNGGVVPPNTSPPAASFTERWRTDFEEAQFVVLTFPFSDYVPWTTSLTTWFSQNYVLISSSPFAYIYQSRYNS